MKKSILITNSYQIPTQKHENFDIPKCESENEFFKLGKTRRKKRNNQLACSMTFNPFFNGQESMAFDGRFSAFSEKGLMINDALTSVTDTSSNAENSICFKNKNMKQKVNKIQMGSSTIQPLVFDFYRKPASRSPRAPKINLPVLFPPQKKVKKFSLENFYLLRKIGQGTYSTVYLAIEKQTNFICSIKSLSKKFIKQQKLLHVVIRQLKIHHYLHHRHIVNLYGQFDDEQNLYLICEYCTDIDLHKYLKQKQRDNIELEVSEVAQFVRQLCQAVAIMHRDFLMHRDIKPQNIFLTFGRFVKLGDFGWAVYFGDHGLRNTQCGTPLYLAPQLIQQSQYSQTVDIWAIGVLTYELLTGEIPFKIRSPKDLHKIVDQNIKFEYIQNNLARDFVQKLLVRDVKDRMEIQEVLQHPFLGLADEEGDEAEQ